MDFNRGYRLRFGVYVGFSLGSGLGWVKQRKLSCRLKDAGSLKHAQKAGHPDACTAGCTLWARYEGLGLCFFETDGR